MKNEIQKLIDETLEKIETAVTAADLELIKKQVLGRKDGALTNILKSLKELTAEAKREFGPIANDARKRIEEAFEQKTNTVDATLAGEFVDLSLPPIAPQRGTLHPMTHVIHDMTDIFASLGFMIAEGPELESEVYNFDVLNIPETHPARDIQDTFFIKTPITRPQETRELDDTKWVMRTHTSNMQVRVMEEHTPPIRCIIPGRVFRNEATDATHDHTFYQLEGFVVDENITVGNLTWFLTEVLRAYYQTEITLRLRPGYFPFTEPGYEVDMSCIFCNQKGCGICKKTGWIELGGSGMVHPNVLKAAGYADGQYTGFAFGLGLSRIAMLKYKLDDIRRMHANELSILKQL